MFEEIDTPSEMIIKVIGLETKKYNKSGTNLDEWEIILRKNITKQNAVKMLPEMRTRIKMIYDNNTREHNGLVELFSADCYDIIEDIANKK